MPLRPATVRPRRLAAFVFAAGAAAALAAGAACAGPFQRIVEVNAPGGVSAISLDRRIVPVYVVVAGDDGRYYRLTADARRRPILALLSGYTAPVAERRPGMLPDGEIARGASNIRMAYLVGPTRRYRHGALGDDVEASGLRAVTDNGAVLDHILDSDSVFEDRLARIADVDGDGRDEIVVVHSYQRSGAALSVFGVVGGRLERIAESAPLGQPNRWLNPVGVADFDGDGTPEIALVATPHIGGTLILYRLTGKKLRRLSGHDGFSNHAMGSRELGLSAIFDADGDGLADIAVPDAGRTALRVVSLAIGRFDEIVRIAHRAPITTALLLSDLDGDGRNDLVYGLADGTVVVAFR